MSLGISAVRSACNTRDWVQSLESEDPLEKRPLYSCLDGQRTRSIVNNCHKELDMMEGWEVGDGEDVGFLLYMSFYCICPLKI